MNSGFYSAYAGFAARMDELDVLANNLSNVNTAGFKAQRDFYRSFTASLMQEDAPAGMMTVSEAVHQAVNQFGVLGGTRMDLTQGSLEMTGNDTDVALEGSGFLAIQTKAGLRYTRNGTFRLDKSRNLVTQQGDQVLSEQLGGRIQPIQIPSGKATISPDGSVSVDGTLVAKLRIEDFPANTPLQQEGNTYVTAPEGSGRPAQNVTVRQGALETSNSDPIRSTVALIDLQRTAQIMEKALSIFHNEFNKTAAQDLPHV
ncbi:MAG TPA: flagellar hook basal-body protein [Candidatus Acidoferrum sp.]|jgi:flagellar basal-body rod protein FlgF/flagellar basal-body rod protein FlgG